MTSKFLLAAMVPALAIAACVTPKPTPDRGAQWVSLVDETSLKGWSQVNGSAPYEIANGVIRGTNVLDTPNSFLATEETYSDFVLEFESRSEGAANSGVQFRTDLAPGTWSGVVGYQLDIDPSKRRWTGGIYHEGVHVWRHTMARNPDCQAAYEHGAWNSYRIEAVGNVIATWVNGVSCAHMVGDHHKSGMIALQVHSIGQETSYLGSFTEWRGIRILPDPWPRDLWLERRNSEVEGWLIDVLSPAEADAGWHQIDPTDKGLSFAVPEHGFEFVIDLQLRDGTEGSLDYALSYDTSVCSANYQIFDDAALASGRPGDHSMGSLKGKREAQNLSEPGRPKRYNSDEKWNRVKVRFDGERVQHWLNGVKVVAYDYCDPNLSQVLARSDRSSHPSQIQLRIHQGDVRSRKAKIRSIETRPLNTPPTHP